MREKKRTEWPRASGDGEKRQLKKGKVLAESAKAETMVVVQVEASNRRKELETSGQVDNRSKSTKEKVSSKTGKLTEKTATSPKNENHQRDLRIYV